MSNTGKTSTYIRKSSVKESTTPNTGFKKTRFLHEASEGDTLIQLSSLTSPTGAVGYSAPNVSELTQTNLMQWTQNVSVTSSIRGLLIQNLSYVISGASTIKLLFEAEEGEVFEGVIDHNARTGLTMVDAAPLVASGVLAAGDTDFNVGMPFQVGAYSSAKRGVVQVEIDGQPSYRTDGNAPFGPGISGDYYEVHSGNQLGQILRFQPDLVNDRFIMVTSVGALVERPNGSIMAAIETVQGQIDAMVPTLAELAETDETDFQAAPNNVDLKTFGDKVLALERILDVEVPASLPLTSIGAMTIGAVTTPPTKGTVAVDMVQYGRNGDMGRFIYRYKQTVAGLGGSGDYLYSLPAGLEFDPTKTIFFSGAITTIDDLNGSHPGFGTGQIRSGGSSGSAMYIIPYDATRFRLMTSFMYSSMTIHSSSFFGFTNADLEFAIDFIAPIKGWEDKQTIREILGL